MDGSLFLGKSEYADQLPAFDQKICEFPQEIVQMTVDTADDKPQILSKKRDEDWSMYGLAEWTNRAKKSQGLLPGLFVVKVIQFAVQCFTECVCG